MSAAGAEVARSHSPSCCRATRTASLVNLFVVAAALHQPIDAIPYCKNRQASADYRTRRAMMFVLATFPLHADAETGASIRPPDKTAAMDSDFDIFITRQSHPKRSKGNLSIDRDHSAKSADEGGLGGAPACATTLASYE
jgi:hypothetical protein